MTEEPSQYLDRAWDLWEAWDQEDMSVVEKVMAECALALDRSGGHYPEAQVLMGRATVALALKGERPNAQELLSRAAEEFKKAIQESSRPIVVFHGYMGIAGIQAAQYALGADDGQANRTGLGLIFWGWLAIASILFDFMAGWSKAQSLNRKGEELVQALHKLPEAYVTAARSELDASKVLDAASSLVALVSLVAMLSLPRHLTVPDLLSPVLATPWDDLDYADRPDLRDKAHELRREVEGKILLRRPASAKTGEYQGL